MSPKRERFLLFLVNILCSHYDFRVAAHVIDCSLTTHDCHNTTISCNDAEPCFVSCSDESCADSVIECPLSADCSVECNGHASCSRTHFYGPQDGDLTVYCTGEQSCVDSTLNASTSDGHQLFLKGCTNDEACLDVSVYCPPSIATTHNCHIHGNHNLEGVSIYAVNSWNAVNMQYTGSIDDFSDGTIYCGSHYLSLCEISSSWDGCVHSADYCSIDSENQVILPNDNINATLSGSSVLFVSPKDKDSFDLVICGWVLAFIASWLLCGFARWKCKKRAEQQQEEHVRQVTAQHLAHLSHLSVQDIHAILKVAGGDTLQVPKVECIEDFGDHNPNDDVLPPNFDESITDLVQVPTTTASVQERNLPLPRMYSAEPPEITPPSRDVPDPTPKSSRSPTR